MFKYCVIGFIIFYYVFVFALMKVCKIGNYSNDDD
jgi:hypothetical protein